jgi:hypothetical protein
MTALYIFLAALPVSLLGFTAFVVMIAAGIRKNGSADLTSPPRNRLDVITRRATGLGTRRDRTGNDEGEE